MPASLDKKTSAYRISGLSDAEVWDLGEKNVAIPRRKTLYGSGDVIVERVESLGLAVEADDKPLRHANICGWPGEKSEQLSLAQQLAAMATLRLR